MGGSEYLPVSSRNPQRKCSNPRGYPQDRRNQLNGKGPSINLSLEWAREKIGFHLEITARMGHKFFRIAIMHRRESHSSAKEHRTPVLEITFLLVFGKCCAVVC